MPIWRRFHLLQQAAVGLIIAGCAALPQPMKTANTEAKKIEKKVEAKPDDSVRDVKRNEFRIVIDPGHGGKDDGAHGHGLLEKSLCLDISNRLRWDLLKSSRRIGLPIAVKLTRERDIYLPLRERVRIANAWGADVFISIHGNGSTEPRAKGFELYFLSQEASDDTAGVTARFENEVDELNPLKSDLVSILSDVKTMVHITDSSRFAETLYQNMAVRHKANIRGVRQGPFTVLSGTFMPAVLVEVGYISNFEDADKLKHGNYLNGLVNAISTGVFQYLLATKQGTS